MKKVLFVDSLENVEADVLILCHEKLEKELDQKLQGAISFNRRKMSCPLTMTTNGAYPIPCLILPQAKVHLDVVAKEKTVVFAIDDEAVEKHAFAILKKNPVAETLIFFCSNPEEVEKRFQKYSHLLQALSFAKNVISAPANLMPPHHVALCCKTLEKQGVLVTVLDEKELEALHAEALLSIGKGSANPPRMVILEWKGSEEKPIAIVGKGICFDSGGIHLKTAHLSEMKWDKAGAGVVMGILDTLSRLNAPIHVVGILVLAENMPDGKALKPGDVISSLSGKTIEIVDTDCEGRLVLADGITYAQQYFSPKILIDLGTLTLETFGALGGEYAGLFCNDPTLSQNLIQAGKKTGEKLWPLPLGDCYANQIRSSIADLKNAGIPRYGASSTAAEFIRAFVDPNLPWAHIDISGTAWKLDALEQGVTGFGIELLLEYLLNQIELKRQKNS